MNHNCVWLEASPPEQILFGAEKQKQQQQQQQQHKSYLLFFFALVTRLENKERGGKKVLFILFLDPRISYILLELLSRLLT